MNIALIDNYDSFTYNLVHYLEGLDCKVTVFRNDSFELDELCIYDKIVLSPGPKLPKDAGKMMEVIEKFHQTKSILGICLGHQAIGEFFGGKLYNLQQVLHGIQTEVYFDENSFLFKNIQHPLLVGRYHSWAINTENAPDLLILSKDKNGIIMAVQHRKWNVTGIQFHPESILTNQGMTLLKNWLEF